MAGKQPGSSCHVWKSKHCFSQARTLVPASLLPYTHTYGYWDTGFLRLISGWEAPTLPHAAAQGKLRRSQTALPRPCSFHHPPVCAVPPSPAMLEPRSQRVEGHEHRTGAQAWLLDCCRASFLQPASDWICTWRPNCSPKSCFHLPVWTAEASAPLTLPGTRAELMISEGVQQLCLVRIHPGILAFPCLASFSLQLHSHGI